MKKILFAMTILICNGAAAAEQNPSTALGLTLGSPNGVTGRTWFSSDTSLDYGAGWSLMDSNQFEIYSDYLWAKSGRLELNGEKFDLFYGGGLSLRTHSGKGDHDLVFGPRLPVGVSYEFSHPDLEVFALFALNVGVVPSSDVYLDLHVGARFYLF
jgi:hypothetical protein